MQSSKVQFKMTDFAGLFAILMVVALVVAVVTGVWSHVGPIFADASTMFDTTTNGVTGR